MDVLVTPPALSAEARAVLEGAGHRLLRPWPGTLRAKREEGDSMCQPEVAWVRLDRLSDSDLIGIRTLACNCTDVSHLPLAECERRGVRVFSLQDCREAIQDVSSTAELTVALTLNLLRDLPAAIATNGTGNRYDFVGRELRGKRVGIVGYGRVGRQVASLVQAFGAQVEWLDNPHFTMSNPWDIYRWADIITIHASLNDTSRGMLNAERFAQMRKGSLLVNTARGAIVDEAALLEALKSGHLAGASLDVTHPEPPSAELLRFARENPGRLLLTPHVGGSTVEGMRESEMALATVLVEALR